MTSGVARSVVRRVALMLLVAAVAVGIAACGGRDVCKRAKNDLEQRLEKVNTKTATSADLLHGVADVDAYYADPRNERDPGGDPGCSTFDAMRGHQKTFVSRLLELAKSNDQQAEQVASNLDSIVIRPTRERLRQIEAAQRLLVGQAIAADAAKPGVTVMSDSEARQTARDVGAKLDDTATLRDAAAGASLALNRAVVDFYEVWSPLMKVPKLENAVRNTYGPYVMFASGKDVEAIRPNNAVAPAELPALLATVEQFAWRFPDPGAKWPAVGKDAKPAFDGAPGRRVAQAWGRYRVWQSADESGRKHMQEPVIARLGKETGGVPERELLNMIVEDMLAVWGPDMEPAARFRKDVVKPFAESTSLTAPSPVAMVVMILGSLILFGGLVMGAVRSTRAGRAAKAA